MKKVFTVVAVILLAAGAAVFAYAFAAAGFDFSKLGTAKYETNTYAADGKFERIVIDAKESDVTLKPSADGKFSVVCFEREKMKHSASVEDGTLRIGCDDRREWYDFLTFFRKTASMTVYLPAESYESLVIEGDTGSVDIPGDFSFGGIDVRVAVGRVFCGASASGTIRLKTSTGDVRIGGVKAGEIELFASTGKIEASDVECGTGFSAMVSTGKITISDLSCKKLESKGSTGRITLENVTASDAFDIERSTGDVRLDDCDANEIRIVTSTGGISGTLKTGKEFRTKTSTGRVVVPDSAEGGECVLTTSTGNIEISVKD
ncbi:MAG: DUF4097 family beta strand repeat protein [Clostridia bacterium]|nr:DUF4097 family beta strand repeat protein [Clostridia bacterium]